jgi:hypothetical protein
MFRANNTPKRKRRTIPILIAWVFMAELGLDFFVGAAFIVYGDNPWHPFRKLRKKFDFDVFVFDVRNHLGLISGIAFWTSFF